MKITSDTIYGNIGYVVEYSGTEWLLIGFNWHKKMYIAQCCHDPDFIAQIHVSNLVGATIVKDEWEDLQPYEEIYFNPEANIKNVGKRSKKDLFRMAKDRK